MTHISGDPPGAPTVSQAADTKRDFVFVCYSHADREVVLSQLEWLQDQGYSVWYDDKIRGGAEWNDELARHIQDCQWFLYFVSPRSVTSQHCRAEINYARQHERRIIAIELEPTDVPAGMQLMLNDRQIVFKHKYSNDAFRERLLHALQAETSIVTSSTGLRSLKVGPTRKRNRLMGILAGAALLALTATATYKLTSAPDIAFKQHDWIVVGDLQNRTDNPVIGEALETSLRVALEQSKYASVLPVAMVREARSRMLLDPDAPLDHETATALAQREDAKASVLGRITQLGGGYQISIDIVDAATGANAWAGEVTAPSSDDLLPAIDEISKQVREQLGESLSSIQAFSLPLAKVTTGDLEALRLYSLAERAVARGEWESGEDLLLRALERDPEFAMAHGKLAAIYISFALEEEKGYEQYELALRYGSRLSPREKIYIEASNAWRKKPEDMRRSWTAMTEMFPQQAVGFNNLGEVYHRYFLDHESAEAEYRASAELRDPWNYMAVHNHAKALVALGRSEEGLARFQESFEISGNPVMFGLAEAYIVMHRFDEAVEFLSTAGKSASPNFALWARYRELELYADRGELDTALDLARRLLAEAADPDQTSRMHAAIVALLEGGSDANAFMNALRDALEFELDRHSQTAERGSRNVLGHLAILARVAVRNGAGEVAEPAIRLVRESLPGNGFPVDQALYELLEAELLLQRGDPEEALKAGLRSVAAAGLWQANESLARIHSALGNEAERVDALEWMQYHRGLAFMEILDWFYGPLFNILDWARADRELRRLQSDPQVSGADRTASP